MAEYIIVVRRPGAPQTSEVTTPYRLWVDTFADIFDGTTLRPEVFEVIERTNAGIDVYTRTQLEAVAAAVDLWTDQDETWKTALP